MFGASPGCCERSARRSMDVLGIAVYDAEFEEWITPEGMAELKEGGVIRIVNRLQEISSGALVDETSSLSAPGGDTPAGRIGALLAGDNNHGRWSHSNAAL
jgi:hypothetical protein